MTRPTARPRAGRVRRALLLALLLAPLGGCPLNGADMVTSVVQAALTSASTSIVQAIAAQLGGSQS
jgi:hypothetical protein